MSILDYVTRLKIRYKLETQVYSLTLGHIIFFTMKHYFSMQYSQQQKWLEKTGKRSFWYVYCEVRFTREIPITFTSITRMSLSTSGISEWYRIAVKFILSKSLISHFEFHIRDFIKIIYQCQEFVNRVLNQIRESA